MPDHRHELAITVVRRGADCDAWIDWVTKTGWSAGDPLPDCKGKRRAFHQQVFHRTRGTALRAVTLSSETQLVSDGGWLRAAVMGANDGIVSTANPRRKPSTSAFKDYRVRVSMPDDGAVPQRHAAN